VEALKCGRCGAARDTNDNFCRSCGHQLTVNLPALRQSRLPAGPQAIPRSLIGSVAVLAVGTSIEWLARRFAGSAARGAVRAAGRALVRQDRVPTTKTGAASPAKNVSIDEVIYVRKIELRR
jgi:hypothetical protein